MNPIQSPPEVLIKFQPLDNSLVELFQEWRRQVAKYNLILVVIEVFERWAVHRPMTSNF